MRSQRSANGAGIQDLDPKKKRASISRNTIPTKVHMAGCASEGRTARAKSQNMQETSQANSHSKKKASMNSWRKTGKERTRNRLRRCSSSRNPCRTKTKTSLKWIRICPTKFWWRSRLTTDSAQKKELSVCRTGIHFFFFSWVRWLFFNSISGIFPCTFWHLLKLLHAYLSGAIENYDFPPILRPTDTIDILKKLIAAKTGTRPEKIRLQRQHVVFKNHITLEDYEIKDGSGLEMYYNWCSHPF